MSPAAARPGNLHRKVPRDRSTQLLVANVEVEQQAAAVETAHGSVPKRRLEFDDRCLAVAGAVGRETEVVVRGVPLVAISVHPNTGAHGSGGLLRDGSPKVLAGLGPVLEVDGAHRILEVALVIGPDGDRKAAREHEEQDED